MIQTFWFLVSLFAGLLLGTISNWLYDILKGKLLPEKPSARNIVTVSVFVLTVTSVLLLSQRFAQNGPTDENDAAQSTVVALGSEQLAIQRQIATAQSDIATAQAGNVSGVNATAITARLIDLSGTQAFLALEATRLASGESSSTPAVGSAQQVNPKDGMVSLPVRSGHFLMGSGAATGAPAPETPQHRVYLNDFWIDQTEVTIGMFARFVEETRHATTAETNGYGYIWVNNQWQTLARAYWWDSDVDSMPDDANLPVSQVSWYDADAYCTWAGRRLPTEAEWEKAARGADGRTFPWGNTNPDSSRVSFNHESGAVRVGSYPDGASPYRAFDMAGNLWEWTADWYSLDYYDSSPGDNPTGPPSGNHRVLRGGGWNSGIKNIQATYRDVSEPHYYNNILGFRCAT